MTRPSAAFREQLAGFSRADLVAFLGDLWEARGWTVETREDRVVARDPSSNATRTLLAVTTADVGVDGAVDVVVASTDSLEPTVPDGVAVLDPDDLYAEARYALDEDASDRLLAEHFDLPDGRTNADTPARATDATAPVPIGPDVAAEESDRASGEGGAVGDTDGDTEGEDDDTEGGEWNPDGENEERDAGSHPVGSTRRAALVVGGALATGLATSAAARFGDWSASTVAAPGLTADGVTDPEALADAHVAVIADASYSLSASDVTRGRDRGLRSYLSLDLALTADRDYHARVATAGPDGPEFLGNPPERATYYSEGTDHAANLHSDGADTYHSFEPRGIVGAWQYWALMIPFGGTYVSRPGRYYRILFTEVPTRFLGQRDGPDGLRYHVAGHADRTSSSLETVDASTVRDVDLAATVDADGVVRSVDVRYEATVDDARLGVHRTVSYADVGATTVDAPDWYD